VSRGVSCRAGGSLKKNKEGREQKTDSSWTSQEQNRLKYKVKGERGILVRDQSDV